MVDEDSHSTDLSVSGEEVHSTILLAHYIFGFYVFEQLLSNFRHKKHLLIVF